ncbi:hypothetical protein MDAP_001029 [Mitosporidium daphniae]|uniref:Uncharacterized protein n=1 Tax=Mitosporidium daphniae TaxID=1485682 RepID=A0A098VRL7_9MICR|nr:uncharacterized protein DI09_35p270 [Mitosporidium daphniae]KGG51439.1 hypothetical protein DI09_35p270 [Mitosporidium daphniae]|eukprot:XP_013237866.1 uncharacterized protein DI09_35p270 [Mitosporidium daphniae]
MNAIPREVVSYVDVDVSTSSGEIGCKKKDSKKKAKKQERAEKVDCSDSDAFDEPESFQTVALPVAAFLSNPELGPTCGEEYLFVVKEERKLLPPIISIGDAVSSTSNLLTMESLIQMGFSFSATGPV